MDEARGRLLAELSSLRARAEAIGRQLKELEQQDRRSRLRVIPGGAAGSSSPGAPRWVLHPIVATAPFLLAIPGTDPEDDPRVSPPSPREPLDLDGAIRVGLGIDQFPKNVV